MKLKMKFLDLAIFRKKFHCGMRHPNNGQSEGDLSRLTGTSSTSSTPSISSSNDNLDIENNENNLCNDNCAIISSQALILSVNDNENANNIKNSQHLHGHNHNNHHNHGHHHHHHHGHHGHHHHQHHHHHHNNNNQQQYSQQNQQQLYPSYLPEYIDPLEWQKSRKRKERLDSTSSITQVDRKLQRSNSEELITSSDCEVIRRVSSHEDFKKQPQPLQEKDINIECNEDSSTNNLKTITENDNHSGKSVKSHKNSDNQQSQQQQQQHNESTNNFIIRLRLDTSPARSNNHRWSPNRFDDSSENEHERRRSSERFSKTRAPPGRKSGVVKKVGSNSVSGGGKYSRRSGDENAYKYDISHLKYERRGFVSKLKLEEHRKEEAADGEPIISSTSSTSLIQSSPSSKTNDYNDNNLIDLCLQQQQHEQEQRQQQNNNEGIRNNQQQQKQQQQPQQQIQKQQQTLQKNQNIDASTAIPLPWDHSPQDIQSTPVLCRRFANAHDINDDKSVTSTSSNNNQQYQNNYNNQQQQQQEQYYNNYNNQSTAIIAAPAVIIDNEPIKSFRTFNKMENYKTRETMQKIVLPLGLMQTPEERLKIINKKLNALKKKVTILEENYEKTHGYRPSQIERYNDKQIKTALAEINKLRKEKQEIKSDPMAAFGLKVSGGLSTEQKLIKMKDTLDDIQNKLDDKRTESHRPENLEVLTSDQLVQEKTAVQHSLLYFESLYGRPTTRDERDAARPLYDRYRVIKRMITRSISITASGAIGSELPTILEHEAMTYETIQQQSSISTDTTTNSLSDQLTGVSSTTVESSSDNSSGQTTVTTVDSTSSDNEPKEPEEEQEQEELTITPSHQQQQQQSSLNDVNLHMLSLDELWGHLERVREEKKDLKKSIRDFENLFEEQNGRKMLKQDRKLIEETYAAYKENKAKVRLLQALIRKHMAK